MIEVKFFGNSEVPAFEDRFDSLEALSQRAPFKPFTKDNPLGYSGKGTSTKKPNHSNMSMLEWVFAGHKGEPSRYAGWDSTGAPALLEAGELDSVVFGIVIDRIAKTVTVSARSVFLHTPDSLEYEGAEWSLASTVISTELLADGTHYIYLTFDPDDELVSAISLTKDNPISVRLYSITVTSGVPELLRVYRSGDVDIIPMWLRGPTL